jgi:hypothetical protein
MAHRIDAEHGQEGGQGAVVSQPPGAVTPASPARPAAQPVPLHPVQGKPQVGRKPIWDKNNVGFWLAVCIAISLAFSVLYRAIG